METKSKISAPDLESLASHGVHFGALKAHGNPKMKPFIWSNKNIFQIIDLEKSKEYLERALDFLIGIKKKGGVILFVGTGFAAKDITRKTADALGMPYVVERWLGGTFTNFSTIHRRIEYLKNLKSQKASGEFEKYTKYESLKLEEKMEKLEKELGGLADLNRLPDAVWIGSANYDKIAVEEAAKKKVPIAGIVNTNSDPSHFEYPVPAADNSIDAVEYILNLVKNALINVKAETPASALQPETSEKTRQNN